jgi:hypothetical protein
VAQQFNCTCSLTCAALSRRPSDSRTNTSKERIAGLIPAEPIAERPLPAWVAVCITLLQALQRFAVLSGIKLKCPELTVSDDLVGRVIQALRDFDDLVGKIERLLQS